MIASTQVAHYNLILLRYLLYLEKSDETQFLENIYRVVQNGLFYQILGPKLVCSFLESGQRISLQILHNDRALSVNKGENSEYYQECYCILNGIFYRKLGQARHTFCFVR